MDAGPFRTLSVSNFADLRLAHSAFTQLALPRAARCSVFAGRVGTAFNRRVEGMGDTAERINVAICLDVRMLDAACVMVASVKSHASAARPVRVYALTDFAAPELADLAAEMNDASFELVPLAVTNVHGHFPIRDHISAATYLRFLLPELLPDVDRIAYIDVDVVVNRPLDSLYDTPLEGLALAAVPDYPMLVGSRTWPTFFIPTGGSRLRFHAYVEQVLGIPCGLDATSYFNCGVMLFDLAHWRRHDVAGRAIRFLTDNPGVYYMDQDALNVLMGGRYVRLDARWNAFANCCFPAYVNVLVRATAAGRRWEAVRTIWRREAWIVHYAGANKPWAPHEPRTPRDALWWRYAALSPAYARIAAAYRAKETPEQRRRSKIPDATTAQAA